MTANPTADGRLSPPTEDTYLRQPWPDAARAHTIATPGGIEDFFRAKPVAALKRR